MSDQQALGRFWTQVRATAREIAESVVNRQRNQVAGQLLGSVLVDKAGHVIGGGSGGSLLVMAAYRDSAQTITSGAGATRVQWDATDMYDPGAAVTTGASWVYTIPADGIYVVEAEARLATAGIWTAGRASLTIFISSATSAAGGAETTEWALTMPSGSTIPLSLTLWAPCTAGGTIYVNTQQNGGVSCGLTGTIRIYH